MGARGKSGLVPLVLLSVLAVTLGSSHSAGARQSGDQVLPGCGICYPGGYDVNTVGDVQGTVLGLEFPADGPVRLVVAGERDRWVVLGSPAWHWNGAGLRLFPGDRVTVRGSKSLGADGSLYLIAREILPPRSAPALLLRDRRGIPLWSGPHRGREAGRRRNGF